MAVSKIYPMISASKLHSLAKWCRRFQLRAQKVNLKLNTRKCSLVPQRSEHSSFLINPHILLRYGQKLRYKPK